MGLLFIIKIVMGIVTNADFIADTGLGLALRQQILKATTTFPYLWDPQQMPLLIMVLALIFGKKTNPMATRCVLSILLIAFLS